MSETKITVIYNSPTDAEAFEAAFGSEQLEAARQIPGYIYGLRPPEECACCSPTLRYRNGNE